MTLPSERLAWLRLARSRGIGPALFQRLVVRFGSATATLEALPRLRCKGELAEIELVAEAVIESECRELERLGAVHLLGCDPCYPEMLAAIADPPPALCIRGRLDVLGHRPLAIVGARNASGNGRLLARTLAREASRRGIAVVSGLARGIDAAAHVGGLEGSGSTIAVLGNGIDIAYPPENAELLERVAELGLVVSERPPGAPPLAQHFPRRNRIIAGLAQAVLVVEAAARSGSLMTAKLAAEQGREVMAVPGSPLDPRHHGTNQLLRDGAVLVETIDDVLADLPAWAAPARPSAPPAAQEPSRPRPDATAPVPRRAASSAPSADLPERITELVGIEPISVDEVIRQCHATTAEVQHALLDLEMAGRLQRHPGNRISRALA